MEGCPINLARFSYRLILFAALLGTGFTLGYVRGENIAPTASVTAMQTQPDSSRTTAADFRTERQQLRAMERSQLNDIVHSADTAPDVLALAQRRLVDISVAEQQESTLEGLLALRGWENCVVSVHDGGVNVLVPAEMLTRQQSSVILDLTCRETGAQAGNVKIIPINSEK